MPLPLGMRRTLKAALAASLAAGLCACQTTEQKPQVQAAAPPSGMGSDIRGILMAGGLNPAAPGALQTTKMPAEVQQAVAALQGEPAAPAPVAQVGVQPAAAGGLSLPPVATAPTVPPMIAAVHSVGKRGRRGASQFALAPAPTSQMPPVVAAAAAGSASAPNQTLAYAPQGGANPLQAQLGGLSPQNAAQQAPIPSAAAFNQAAQQAALQASPLSQVQSYLPPAPPSMRTVVLTGPNADRRAASAALGGVTVPSPRATQAAVRAMGTVASAKAEPVATASTQPVAAPVPEEPRIRRF